MDILIQAVSWLHLVGFAALVGGCLAQVHDRDPEVNGAMLWGTYLRLITLIAIVAIRSSTGDPMNHYQVGLRTFLLLLVVVLVTANRRFESIPKGVWAIITVLALAESAVAVFWA